MQSNSFKNTFPLDAKTQPAVAGASKNGAKKWFPLARKSVFTSRNSNKFNLISRFQQAEKIKEYCLN